MSLLFSFEKKRRKFLLPWVHELKEGEKEKAKKLFFLFVFASALKYHTLLLYYKLMLEN